MVFCEYIWIDSDGSLRSKSRFINKDKFDTNININNFPLWTFDGSSTNQMVDSMTDIILHPIAYYIDPFIGKKAYLVLCECYDSNMIPIKSNTRYPAKLIFEKFAHRKPCFGFEQEYVLYDPTTKRPLGWDIDKDPPPQGKYYCGVGADRCFGRFVALEHYKLCQQAGLTIAGINGEVMPAQWEFQIGPCYCIQAADELWIARYLLHRLCEKYHLIASFDSKPEKGNWNGSGCHTNYSFDDSMKNNGINSLYKAINKLSKKHTEHLLLYGNNDERLTGQHETSSVNKFTYGVADRSASVRIPIQVCLDKKGYMEDRRPSSDCDPYQVSMILTETTLS